MTREEFDALEVGDQIYGESWGAGRIIQKDRDAGGIFYLVQHERRKEVGAAANPVRWTVVKGAKEKIK